jgi:hypothetical protein
MCLSGSFAIFCCKVSDYFNSESLTMSISKADDGSKRVKNITAVIYLLVMIFIVGGTYLHQQEKLEQPQAFSKETPPK